MLEYLTTAPSFIQVLFIVLALLGAIIVYRFRVIVALISTGAIALYLSLKKDKI